jgi:hypothetical protein
MKSLLKAIAQFSSRLAPVDLHFAVLQQEITRIQIDQVLVKHDCFIGHGFHLVHRISRNAHGHRLVRSDA